MQENELTTYVPFGEEWKKEMMKWTKANLHRHYGVSQDQSKAEMVGEIRTNLIVKKFNKDYPVGSKVGWRFLRNQGEHREYTVATRARAVCGIPVAKFQEKPGFVSVEPEHCAY